MSVAVRVYEVVRFDAGLRCDVDTVYKAGLVEGNSVACAGCRENRGSERWAVICDDGDIQISCSACLSWTLENTGVE